MQYLTVQMPLWIVVGRRCSRCGTVADFEQAIAAKGNPDQAVKYLQPLGGSFGFWHVAECPARAGGVCSCGFGNWATNATAPVSPLTDIELLHWPLSDGDILEITAGMGAADLESLIGRVDQLINSLPPKTGVVEKMKLAREKLEAAKGKGENV
jgi:hypothetical protein